MKFDLESINQDFFCFLSYKETLYSAFHNRIMNYKLSPWYKPIYILSNSRIRTHNHLVHKRTLNHLAKQAKWLRYVVYVSVRCISLWLWLNGQVVLGWNSVAVISDIAPVLSKEFRDIQATIDCGFTLKCLRDMIIIQSSIYYFVN